jgi:hypothetical protein
LGIAIVGFTFFLFDESRMRGISEQVREVIKDYRHIFNYIKLYILSLSIKVIRISMPRTSALVKAAAAAAKKRCKSKSKSKSSNIQQKKKKQLSNRQEPLPVGSIAQQQPQSLPFAMTDAAFSRLLRCSSIMITGESIRISSNCKKRFHEIVEGITGRVMKCMKERTHDNHRSNILPPNLMSAIISYSRIVKPFIGYEFEVLQLLYSLYTDQMRQHDLEADKNRKKQQLQAFIIKHNDLVNRNVDVAVDTWTDGLIQPLFDYGNLTGSDKKILSSAVTQQYWKRKSQSQIK